MAATSLIISGLIAAGSAGLSAYNRAKADKERQRNYENAKSYLNSLYYRDPLSTVGNQSLLKTVKQNHADELDAVQNRMAAGGGTMENALAARQASNEGMDKVYNQLLMGEDARRDRIDQQRLALDQQNSQAIQGSYRQAAQDWQQWGAQTAGAMLSYGSANLLDGAGAAADAVPTFGDMAAKANSDIMKPVIAGGTPTIAGEPTLGSVLGADPTLGGLRGVKR